MPSSSNFFFSSRIFFCFSVIPFCSGTSNALIISFASLVPATTFGAIASSDQPSGTTRSSSKSSIMPLSSSGSISSLYKSPNSFARAKFSSASFLAASSLSWFAFALSANKRVISSSPSVLSSVSFVISSTNSFPVNNFFLCLSLNSSSSVAFLAATFFSFHAK